MAERETELTSSGSSLTAASMMKATRFRETPRFDHRNSTLSDKVCQRETEIIHHHARKQGVEFVRNNDFSFSDEKNREKLARFFKFCA